MRHGKAQRGWRKNSTPSLSRSTSTLPLRRAPVCAVLLRCMGGFGGGLGVTPRRHFCALCGCCGGVLGGQSVQYAAAVFGQHGFFKEGLELLLGQRYGVRQQLLKKPHALAEPTLLLWLMLSHIGIDVLNKCVPSFQGTLRAIPQPPATPFQLLKRSFIVLIRLVHIYPTIW